MIAMNLTYEDILNEARIFARSYSQARLVFSKWRTHKVRVSIPPDQTLSIETVDSQLIVLIYRPFLESIEKYSFEALVKRTQLKRSQLVFKEILGIWKLLNPYHLPGISKLLYVKFYEFLHFSLLNPNAASDQQQLVQVIDAEIDFEDCEIQVFEKFYDTLFENVDYYTKSQLANEYCRVLKRISSALKTASWIKTQDLHNKIYSEGLKPRFPKWAVGYLKAQSLESPARPKLSSRAAPTRPQEKPLKKNKDDDSFKFALQRLEDSWNYRGSAKFKTPSPMKALKKSIKKQEISHQPHNSYDFTRRLRLVKDRKVLEDVLMRRKAKVIENHTRVLVSPLRFLL